MTTYKITNITDTKGKRDFKYNSELDIQLVDNMVKKTIKIKPGDSVFLTISSLPLSVHRLRVKGLITVIEVSPNDIPKKATKPKTEKKKVKKAKKTTVEKKTESTKKKTDSTKKKTSKSESAKTTSTEKDSKE